YALRANWSARDDLHVQGCLILTQVGLQFPVNHAPMKMASLTGFDPVISCMRGRHVVWTTPQGQKWWEVLADGQRSAALSAASRMSSGGRAQAPLLMSYAPEMERVDGIAPSSQPWHGRILLLNHTRKRWCP